MFRIIPLKCFVFSTAIAVLGLSQTAFGQSDFHHLTIYGGGGYTDVVGSVSSRLQGGGNFQVGAGFRFNPVLSINGTFNFNQLGITRRALNEANEPDGNARVYTFTVDPKITIPLGERFSAYVLGGGGWLRRTVEYTQPTVASTYLFDPWFGYFGPVYIPANQVLGTFSQDAGVWDVGAGLNFPLPRTHLKLYVEARYYEGMTSNTHTTVVPITVGLRW